MKTIFITLLFIFSSCSSTDWRTASRESMGIAPKASELEEDILQIYYARAFSWRGFFGVHPWIAWKKKDENEYTIAQVTSWNLRRSGSTVQVYQDIPDRRWFGSDADLLFEIRGSKAASAIKKIKKLLPSYPYTNGYTLWPGPNSNTFIAYLIRNIDELTVELPPHAIGKDYMAIQDAFSLTASKTGVKFSLYGLLGAQVGASEGVYINLLGLQFGVDVWTPAIELPFVGRLGFEDKEI